MYNVQPAITSVKSEKKLREFKPTAATSGARNHCRLLHQYFSHTGHTTYTVNSIKYTN